MRLDRPGRRELMVRGTPRDPDLVAKTLTQG